MAGANVRPLAEIGLAQEHGPGLAQLLRHKRISCWLRSQKCQRSGGGLHAVGGIDIVFDQNRNSVQRTADVSFFSFLVEGIGDGQSVGIDFDDAVERGTLFVDLFDFPEAIPACRSAVVISSNSNGLISGVEAEQGTLLAAARAGNTVAPTPANALVRKKSRRCGEPQAMTASSLELNPVLLFRKLVPANREL
jgi:hypothetical protein